MIKKIVKILSIIFLILVLVIFYLSIYGIKTTNPQLLLGNRSLEIKNIQTNVVLKSLIKGQFSIDNLQITTKEIKIKNIISKILIIFLIILSYTMNFLKSRLFHHLISCLDLSFQS